MKKIIKYVCLVIIVGTLLSGCKADNNQSDKQQEDLTEKFEGSIEEMNEKIVIVKIDEGWNISNSGDRVSVDTSVNDKETFQIGDRVRVTYDGRIMESYPLGIFTISIEKIN